MLKIHPHRKNVVHVLLGLTLRICVVVVSVNYEVGGGVILRDMCLFLRER